MEVMRGRTEGPEGNEGTLTNRVNNPQSLGELRVWPPTTGHARAGTPEGAAPPEGAASPEGAALTSRLPCLASVEEDAQSGKGLMCKRRGSQGPPPSQRRRGSGGGGLGEGLCEGGSRRGSSIRDVKLIH